MIKELIKKCVNGLGYEIYKTLPRRFTKYVKNNLKGELVGAEIGVLYGENTKSILKELNIKKLYLIDPYKYDKDFTTEHANIYKKMNMEKLYKKVKAKFSKIKNVKLIRDKSENVKIKEKLDFVYIDGNHTYEYVKKDIEKYYPLIKEGGILGGHDFQTEFLCGVVKAVFEFLNKNPHELHTFGSDWWIVK